MNPDEERTWLESSFDAVRRADERGAPAFERDWQAAVRRTRQVRQPAVRVGRLAAAAAVLVVAAVGIAAALLNSRSAPDGRLARRPVASPGTVTRPADASEPEATVSIEEWESPTAGLLDLSSEEGPSAGRESF